MNKEINTDYVYGRQAVLEAMKSGKRTLNRVWLAKGVQGHIIQEILTFINRKNVPFNWVLREKLDQLTRENHQGVIAQVSPVEYLDLDDLLANIKTTNPVLCIAVGIEDPQNLGAIIRSAAGLEVDGIILPEHRSAGVTAVSSHTSAGGIEHIPIARVTNIAQTIDRLKEKGYWIYGADNQGQLLWKTDFGNSSVAVVLGSEGSGIPRLVKEKCDFLVKIPVENISSYNVSVASGIIFYEIQRQRKRI